VRNPGVIADAAVYRDALDALVDHLTTMSMNNPEAGAEWVNEVAEGDEFARVWVQAQEALGR
jgi:hypothetical protein